MWGSNYETNALKEFTLQLEKTDAATSALQREVMSLEQSLKTTSDDALQQKLDYLKGVVSSSRNMKKALELKHIGVKEEYMDLNIFPIEGGSARLYELNEVYSKMTLLLSVSEQNIYKILGTPTNWFGTQVAALESWLKMQPFKAGSIVVGSAAFMAGVLALIADAGCKCGAWTVLGHVAFGACVGGGVALLGLLLFAGYECCYRRSQAKSDTQKVEEMVNLLRTIPDNQYIKQLDDLIADCLSVGGKIPGHEDRLCVACHNEGYEVVEPVRARGCKGHHYMCKACWKEYLRTPGGREGKCPVCRV
ncbi:unnamed protein product [Symbiodinium natans]|uniref:RING-type domain-containing protein n=1 Tax=Symbiodinium natans TaxID=878477 RepID=A0A812PGQ9_9DINO|nr:unnamed protein product [Symbiodinium natans]